MAEGMLDFAGFCEKHASISTTIPSCFKSDLTKDMESKLQSAALPSRARSDLMVRLARVLPP